MPLMTNSERLTLTSWNWDKDFVANRFEFIQIGKIVYTLLASYGQQRQVGPDDLVDPFAQALIEYDMFQAICARKSHASPGLYPVFGHLLAKYIIDSDWSVLTVP